MRTFWRWWRSPYGRYFLYSRWQRLLHRFNFHHTRTSYPDGDTLLRCDWCGLTCVTHRAAWRFPRADDLVAKAAQNFPVKRTKR